MRKIFIVLAIAAVGFASCKANTNAEGNTATEETAKKPGRKIKTESDSLSYALAVSMGDYIKNMQKQLGSEINLDVMIAAIRDIQDDKYSLDEMQANAFLNNYFSFILPERKLKEGEAYLAKVEKETPGIQKTESGLMYEIIQQGNDVKAVEMNDRVRVMYRGLLKDGTEFDSSYLEGRDTTEFAIGNVIQGWTEGLKLIGEGGKIKLWIPAELAYGSRGNRAIGPNEPLFFEVELFKVIPAEVKE
jgi:FKBP-type peptidyl-prolyl cis-trans isomerases 1